MIVDIGELLFLGRKGKTIRVTKRIVEPGILSIEDGGTLEEVTLHFRYTPRPPEDRKERDF